MIFNLLVFLVIVLLTLYMATQGMVSAIIALITATFSSLLAMALTESLESLVGKVSLEFQRGLTFLAIYLLTFGITRVVADILIPRNIKVPLLVNRAVGGLIGFFASLVVVGTIIIGLEMLPLPTDLMGYNRFPAASNMQALDADGKPIPGTVARQSGVWLNPDRFTLAIWSGASGRGLGGARSFEDVHPDLSVESYGFRRNLQYASKRTVPPENFDVPAVWMSADPNHLKPLGIDAGPGQRAVVARAVVTLGEKSSRSAADSDEQYFRVTPSEVRLVTDKGRQYYPIGYLEHGSSLVKTDLETGQVVDDFVKGRVVEDWVFLVQEDEKPAILEIKQTARKELVDLKDKPVSALARGDYPQKPYQKERSSLVVTVSGIEGITESRVLVMRSASNQKDVGSELRAARDKILAIQKNIEDSTNGWSRTEKPGMPSHALYAAANNRSINLVNKAPTDSVEWQAVLELLLTAQMQSEPGPSITALSTYIKETLVPLFAQVTTGNPVLVSGTLEGGKGTLPNIPKGDTVIFVTARSEKGFYVWISSEIFTSGEKTLSLNAGSARLKVENP